MTSVIMQAIDHTSYACVHSGVEPEGEVDEFFGAIGGGR